MHPPHTPRVERRVIGAKTWRDCTGDVLDWDGTVLRIASLPGNVMMKGAAWRIDGALYAQRYLDTSGPVRVWLAPADESAEV